jgi:Copper transport outer membrane protein, MctB
MIDFRYHIVSIVSIFLALAVGIVLGAGPLQGRLGDTLSKEVAGLRNDKSKLNTELRTVTANVSDLNNFAKAVGPELITGRLAARSITIVRLPGSSDGIVNSISDAIDQAGAKVNGTVKVTKAWTDPDKKALRDGLATSLAPLARSDIPVGASQDQGLASVLARGLVVTDSSAADKADAGATTALKGLKTGGLIDYSGDGPLPATMAIVVAGPPTPGESDQLQRDEAGAYAVVTRALDAQSAGGIAASDPSAATSGGTLEALRSDKQASAAVSTVDDADQPMGVITVVLALREQLAGSAGQYGVGVGATKIIPAFTSP